MERLYFIRHGQRASKSEDTLLSDEGKKQAELTGKYLSSLSDISLIYASPLIRAQQTAEIISNALNLSIQTDARLTERMRWGDRIGESYNEFIREWNKTSINRNYEPPMGDSSYNVGNRVKALADEISNNQRVVIVSHSGAIGDFLRNVFDEKLLNFKTDPESSIRYIEILECSITEINKERNEFKLKRINDTSHLETPVI